MRIMHFSDLRDTNIVPKVHNIITIFSILLLFLLFIYFIFFGGLHNCKLFTSIIL